MIINSMFLIPKDRVSETQLRQDLMVFGTGYQNTAKVVKCYKSLKNHWAVPIPYAQSKGWLKDAADQTPDIQVEWPEIEFEPRHNQEEVVTKTINYLLSNRTGRIEAKTGYGKTQVSLEIARRMKQNVLFLAHKDDILTQVEMTAKVYFGVKCGYIKGKKENPNEIITLATMQTMAKRVKDNPDYLNKFGLMILDEQHRASCDSYIAIMETINRRYTLGISATYRRGDNLEAVWDNFIGDLICKGVVKNAVTPILESPTIGGTGLTMQKFIDRQGEISHTKVLTIISENVPFNMWLVNKIVELVADGRRVLLVTNRKEQLETLEDMLRLHNIESGIYAGGKHRNKTLKRQDLTEGMKKDVVLATVKKVGEGFDETMFLGKEEAAKIKPLDTIIIASPISDSEQVIGRIGRREGGNHPLIIHPVIDLHYCKSLYFKCVKNTYKPLGILKG